MADLQPGTVEAGVAKAAVDSLPLILNLETSQPEGAYTLVSESGDTLVAHANIGGDSRADSLWIWDAPFETTYILHAAPSLLTREALIPFLESRVVWEQGRIGLCKVELSYAKPRYGADSVVGRVTHPSDSAIGYYVAFAGTVERGDGWIEITVSKSLLSDKYPPETTAIRERFPPLRSRIELLSTAALFELIGDGFDKSHPFRYPVVHDALVIDELLKRSAISRSDVSRIVFESAKASDDADRMGVNERARLLISALQRRNELQSFASAFEDVCLNTTIKGISADTVDYLFFTMEKNAVDFTEAAFKFIERGLWISPSLAYLAANGRGPETLKRLRDLSVPPAFDEERTRAIRALSKPQ